MTRELVRRGRADRAASDRSFTSWTLVLLLATVVLPSSAAAQALPVGWTATNVGGAPVASASFANGVFSTTAAGVNIGGKTDQFMFVHRQLTGDGVIVAQVASLQSASSAAQAGLMVRETLAANARHAYVHVDPSKGIVFQRRTKANGQGQNTNVVSGAAPVWLKLERRDNALTASHSADGITWTPIATQTVSMTASVYVGLAATSGSASQTATATFARVDQPPAGSAPVNQPPSVALTAPAASASYVAPATITIAATAADADGSIAGVDFYEGATLLASKTAAPYSYAWSVGSAGTYSLTAVARDNAGAATTSSAVIVSVTQAPNQSPNVSLTSPALNATYVAPASITVSATASDVDGTVARVDFYQGSTLIGSDMTSPYSITWANVAAGAYSVIAVARDNAGGTTVSSARAITVTDPLTPNKALFAPSVDHALVNRYLLEIFVAGSDPTSASPMATHDLGKPAVVNGECAVDISTTIVSLAQGSYIATVTAIGVDGSSRSAPSPVFLR